MCLVICTLHFFFNGNSPGSRRRDCRSHLRMTQVIGRKKAWEFSYDEVKCVTQVLEGKTFFSTMTPFLHSSSLWAVFQPVTILNHWDFPGGSDGKESACNAGDLGSISGSGRSPGRGNGNTLRYSCLENPMDGGAWWATVHGVAKSQTWLNNFTLTFFHAFFYDFNQYSLMMFLTILI